MVKIDRASVRRNPRAGETTLRIPGRRIVEHDQDGRITKVSFQEIVLYDSPQSPFLFEYKPKVVQCEDCDSCFSYEDLDNDEDSEGRWIQNICPVCRTPSCCELVFEELSNQEMEAICVSNC